MSRYARKSEPNVRPVKRIELPEGKLTLRVVLLCLAVVIAITAFSYGMSSLFSSPKGWQEIQVSSQFVLQYDLGAGELSATAERKQISRLCAETLDSAYKLLSGEEYPDVTGIHYLNTHPGETVPVDPVLYRALKTAAKSRVIYLAPLFSDYTGVYASDRDTEAELMDPYLNDEEGKFAREILEFAGDPEQIQLELLPDDQVCLRISQEYLAFGAENKVESYLDFGWLKNAFLLDAVADALIEQGFTRGILSSWDGFSRILSPMPGTTNLFAASEEGFWQTGRLSTEAACSFVSFRDFQTSKTEDLLYYTYDDGAVRTPFVSMESGFMRTGKGESLIVYSEKHTCGELAVTFYETFAESEDGMKVAREQGIPAVYCTGKEITRSDPAIQITDIPDDVKLR